MSTQPARRAARGRWLAIAASVVVVATVASALIVIGPPAQQRRVAMDARRTTDLIRLANVIEIRGGRDQKLPAALPDPESGAPDGYAVTGDRSYRLCAVFATATRAGDVADRSSNGEWSHPAGRYCFSRNIKKD